MSFYDDLAGAKTRGASDGDYFLPDQTGTLVIHGLINKQTTLKRTVILLGEIVEAKSKLANGPVQAPGTKVKKIYSLSKFTFHMDMLKTDLIRILGMDEKTVTPQQVSDIFRSCFEGGALTGVMAGFSSSQKLREGKVPINEVYFSHVDESAGNAESEIAARAAAIAK